MARSCAACRSGKDGTQRMDRRDQRLGIDLVPGALIVGADEVAAARSAIDARVVDAGRPFALGAQVARGEQKTAARPGVQLLGGGETLEPESEDGAHAVVGSRVLQMY